MFGKSLVNSTAAATAILALICASHGLADTTFGSWLLDQSNTFGAGSYGRVDIVANSDVGVGTVEFTVDVFDVQPTYGTLSNFGIQAFGFNFDNLTSSTDDWVVSGLPADWSLQDGRQMDGFGAFLADVDGTGGARQDPLTFTITLPTASEAVVGNFAVFSSTDNGQSASLFAAHVAGFENGPGSHWVATVPVPSAMILVVIGLGTVGLAKRRGRASAS